MYQRDCNQTDSCNDLADSLIWQDYCIHASWISKAAIESWCIIKEFCHEARNSYLSSLSFLLAFPWISPSITTSIPSSSGQVISGMCSGSGQAAGMWSCLWAWSSQKKISLSRTSFREICPAFQLYGARSVDLGVSMCSSMKWLWNLVLEKMILWNAPNFPMRTYLQEGKCLTVIENEWIRSKRPNFTVKGITGTKVVQLIESYCKSNSTVMHRYICMYDVYCINSFLCTTVPT